MQKWHPNFDKMDTLSTERIPFFFLVDFEMKQVEIYQENELKENNILIDFQNFKTKKSIKKNTKQFQLETFPQTLQEYKTGFDIVQKNLKLGNSYLINYTQKTAINTNFSLEEIFHQSKAKYKVFYKDLFTFFSPESFVKIENHTISTFPMKGTIDASIKNAYKTLKTNTKEKAEHYTVVDLLRNDLSTIANNVSVKKFQKIDLIKTQRKDLYAMSSEIEGEIKPEFKNKIGSILRNLLPAGSILGAPKPKTLEIILEAENYKRNWYTGVCGWFDGENLDSCVMIRFIEKDGNQLFFKSGGGITHQSILEDEYLEMKNKIYVPIY